MKNIEYTDYTKGEFYKLPNYNEIKNILDLFLKELEKKDTEKLLFKKSTEIRVEYTYNCGKLVAIVYIEEDIRNRITNNRAEFYFTIDEAHGDLLVYECISAFNYPKRERRLILYIDNIEFRLGHRDRTRLKIGSEKDVPWVVDYILLEGYAIWGNKWGYVTKLGRKARGTLKTRYGWRLVWHKGDAYWQKTRAWFKKHKQIEID